MTYSSATQYLLGTINETVSRRTGLGLERMQALLHELGDPHLAYPTLHVGGTSGKGSTASILAAALTRPGQRVALHTKPHLSSMTERARIDGVAISEDRFGSLLSEMMPAIERVAAEHGRPSYYETLLALALTYFAQEQVDIAVIEVGVGGRLDGTNVLRPAVSVITNVSLDHTEILGDTVEAIAAEKAGIAKPGTPLVSDVEQPGARAVIEGRCAEVGAPFLSVRDLVRVDAQPGERYGQRFHVQTPQAGYDLALPVIGAFQRRNVATAILALEQLREPLRPSVSQIEEGLSRLVVPGRMEFFPSHPAVVFDIAHNPDKAQHLADALRESFPDRRFVFVVAIGESKDARDILAAWAPLPANFIFSSFETAGRTSTRPQRLASIAEGLGAWGRAVSDPIEAFTIARRNSSADDIIVVTGSTFIVATVRDWWIANVVSTSAPS